MLSSQDDTATAEASAAVAYGSRYSSFGGESSSDFCACERRPQGGFTLAIGNASSVGAASKRSAHAAKRAFRMAALAQASPSKIVDEVERLACTDGPGCSSTSLFVATVGLDDGMLTYAGTGDGGALVFRDVRGHEHLDFDRTSKAGRKRLPAVQRTVAFPPGSVLVAYTGGLARASAEFDGSPLGSAGIVRIVHHVLRVSAAPVCSRLWQEIDHFTGGSYRHEATLTLVVALEANRAL